MPTFVLRTWLPDRPGALGQVASRIGSVRGEIVGIDILERGAGRVIDELVIQLPEADLVDLLVTEVGHVDGVDVEEVRPVLGAVVEHRIAALQAATAITTATSIEIAAKETAHHAAHLLRADYSAVLDRRAGAIVAGFGEAPDAAWLQAFVDGSPPVPATGAEDIVWATLGDGALALVVARTDLGFRSTERQELQLIAQLAGAHLRTIS